MTTTSAACSKMRRAAARARTAKLLDVRHGSVRVPPVACTHEHHEHIKLTAWSSLRWVGVWRLIPDDPQAMANCRHCNSTLMRDATPEDLEREAKEAA